MKILLLHDLIPDGASEDAKDVLVQAEAISKALSDLGHRITTLFFTLDIRDIIDAVRGAAPDIVFNLVESAAGDGSLIFAAPALLDHIKIPYTGSKTDVLFLTSNKLLSKKILRASGLPTPDWFTMENGSEKSVQCHSPYIIKSVWEHASIGLGNHSVVIPRDGTHINDEIRSRKKAMGRDFFAELYIEGREFNISLLENDRGVDCLPPAEIRFIDFPKGKWKILDYSSKWEKGAFEYQHTVRSFDLQDKDNDLVCRLKEIAKECWEIFHLRGYARVDFRVDQDERPWILEINANPCLAPDSGFAASAAQAGLHSNEVVKRILDASLS
ncbi:MAG: D-alanine--D-alanine ligase family protein [bacterium]